MQYTQACSKVRRGSYTSLLAGLDEVGCGHVWTRTGSYVKEGRAYGPWTVAPNYAQETPTGLITSLSPSPLESKSSEWVDWGVSLCTVPQTRAPIKQRSQG